MIEKREEEIRRYGGGVSAPITPPAADPERGTSYQYNNWQIEDPTYGGDHDLSNFDCSFSCFCLSHVLIELKKSVHMLYIIPLAIMFTGAYFYLDSLFGYPVHKSDEGKFGLLSFWIDEENDPNLSLDGT